MFDSAVNLFVGWDDGAHVYTLNPETWEWKKLSVASGNTVSPDNAATTGTFGRFQYIESRNAYVLVNSVTNSVYLYRLSEGVGAGIIRPNQPDPFDVQ